MIRFVQALELQFLLISKVWEGALQVTVRLGSPITGYGQETRNRAARQRISHRTFTDEDGIERVEVRYVHFFLSAEAYFLPVFVVCEKKKYLF